MGENEMKSIADALWAYFLEKHLKPYLNDSMCYYQATVTTAPSAGLIGITRPFDVEIFIPYAWSAATLSVGDKCTVLVFGETSNAVAVGDGALSAPATMIAWYGESSTGASTQTKAVTIPGITALVKGLHISVKFTNGQSYNGAAKLNLNGLGGVTVLSREGTDALQYCWNAGEVVDFVYDGTNWIMTDSGIATTTYYGITKLTSSTSSTSTSLAASAAAVKAVMDAIPAAYTSNPEMDGTASAGDSVAWARGNHVHPTDTSRATVDSPTFTGTPEAPTAAAGTDTTQIATTAFVNAAVAAETKRYSYAFTTSDWTGSGPYTLTLTAATHGCGTDPTVDVLIKNGTAYEKYYSYPTTGWKLSIASTGNLTLTAPTAFDGKLKVSQ